MCALTVSSTKSTVQSLGTSQEQAEPPEPPSDEDEDEDEDDNGAYEDDDAAHIAAIEESRRKLAELEKDRDAWEQAARDRERREQEEEERQRRWRRAEAERRATVEREQEEIRRRVERERRERAQAQRHEQEQRARQQRERWGRGPWTSQRALERYKSLCETFDATRFTSSEPLSFEAVPWPTLISPLTLTVEDVDWATVEKFFETVKAHMKWQDYKLLVEKSHRRFHPDRWSSRGLLNTVADDTERGDLEVAANTVAQALTPLWRDLKGQ